MSRDTHEGDGQDGGAADVGRALLTTVTLCGYARGRRLWAFNRMGSARRELARTRGLRFWKLLGVGLGNGFSLRPDLSRYGLLAVWEDGGAADEFFAASPLFDSYRRHAAEIWTVRLVTLQAHGAWSGVNPFLRAAAQRDEAAAARPCGAPRRAVAVLTRASVRPARLRAFWGAVPATTRELEEAGGLVVSVGTGEAPWLRPATFSLWRDEAAVREFAYGAPAHRDAIRRRAEERWYSEELFARFAPVRSEGTWKGRDPLAGLL